MGTIVKDDKEVNVYSGLKFVDTMNFMRISLEKLVGNLEKPSFGQAILDLFKTIMYNFHHGYVKPKYGDWARLLFTDTDFLCYRIQTEVFYEDIVEDVPNGSTSATTRKNIPSEVRTKRFSE